MTRRQRTYSRVRVRVAQLKGRGALTSKGEPMSLAAIGRTLEPPVHRCTMYLVAGGYTKSARVTAAIEKELGMTLPR